MCLYMTGGPRSHSSALHLSPPSHIAGLRSDSQLLGRRFYDETQVSQWLEYCQTDLSTVVRVLTKLRDFPLSAEQRAAVRTTTRTEWSETRSAPSHPRVVFVLRPSVMPLPSSKPSWRPLTTYCRTAPSSWRSASPLPTSTWRARCTPSSQRWVVFGAREGFEQVSMMHAWLVCVVWCSFLTRKLATPHPT